MFTLPRLGGRGDLVLFYSYLTELLDENGIPDPQKVGERAQQLVDWKPGLAKGARVPIGSFGQGRRAAVDQVDGVTWGAVLRGR